MPKVTDEVCTRPPWERMMRIHENIRAGAYPNCRRLAAELEMSVRTIKRDVDFMKYRLNLAIEYERNRNGYYYTEAVERFPSAPMSEAELFSLLVARKAIAQYQGTPFQRPLETAFRKLTGLLGKKADMTLDGLDKVLSFRPFAPGEADLEVFGLLTRALQEHRQVQFDYRNLGTAQLRERQVRRYHLACIDNHWYLLGFDLGRQAIRTFVLTRMKRLTLAQGRFRPPTDFDPNEYLRDCFTVYKGQDDFEVVVLFDAWAADLVRDRQWHPSQQATELPGGHLRLQMRLNNIEEMERWVLGWGTHATVVRPQMLIDRVRNAAEELAKRYPAE